jgi:two-component system sensor histidine kinase/response regulator
MPVGVQILAVDDNPRNLAILQRCLGQEFDLTQAVSGQEALEIATRLRPDVILLDIMMPGLDGYETCRRLRGIPEVAGTKIIMVSAKAMTSERLEGYAAGADDYIVKPFDSDELISKVRVYARLKSVEEVDRLKSDLLDLLSHETGTPLTGIMGGLALLRDDSSLSKEQLELLEVAEVSTLRLQALVKRVCLIAQLKARTMPVIREPFDLRDLVANALEAVHGQAEKARVKMMLEPGESVPASGDVSLLLWVVEALLENAIRLSPRDGLVSVHVGLEASGPCLSVSDQGPGIEPELLPRIFQEFVVADIKHHKKGSGLSLAAARLVAENHGGTLSVETELGRGSVFHLKLAPYLGAALAA